MAHYYRVDGEEGRGVCGLSARVFALDNKITQRVLEFVFSLQFILFKPQNVG